MAFSRRPCAQPCPHLYCNEHGSTETGDEYPHTCLYCSRTFNQVSSLIRHESSQHPENMYGGSGRNTDMVIEKRFMYKHRCPHCRLGCIKKYILGNHVRAMHTALQATESTETVPGSIDEGESSASESPRRVTPVTPRMRNCFPSSIEILTRSNAPSPSDSLMDFNTQAKADTGYQTPPRSYVLASLAAERKMESGGR